MKPNIKIPESFKSARERSMSFDHIDRTDHPLNTTRPICALCGSTDIELDGEERRPFYCRCCNSTEIKFPTPRRDPIEQMKTEALSSAMDTLDRAIETINNLGVTVEIPAPSYMNAKDPVSLRSCTVDFRYAGNNTFVTDIPIPTAKKFPGTEVETDPATNKTQMELPFSEDVSIYSDQAPSCEQDEWSRYQRNALRTESNPASDPEIPKRVLQHLRVLHAIMGKLTELGELADAFKKHWYYGAPLDMTNVEEEIGDEKWYDAILLDALSLPLSSILAQNGAKLRKRYPNTFSSQDALERDLEGERATLENHSSEGDDYDYVQDDLN